MTDSSLPPSFDENAGEDAEVPIGEYDALPDEPDRLSNDEEFDAIDITQSDGPDLEAGDDLDTGAGGGQRRRDFIFPN